MKKIIITAGPTNERIDSVMKITNMSTGALGCIIANKLLLDEEIDTIYYIGPKMIHTPEPNDKIKRVFIESTDELLSELKNILTSEKIHTVIHSSAVGDYRGEFVINAETLAKQICEKLDSIVDKKDLYDAILQILINPQMCCDDSTKISSYEQNLMVKLGLTPKVISSIKELSPETQLIGFKLLDKVSKDYLYNVAHKLLVKNQADFVVANDLSEIGHGRHRAMIIDKNGIVGECETKEEIAEKISVLIKYKM